MPLLQQAVRYGLGGQGRLLIGHLPGAVDFNGKVLLAVVSR